MHDERDNVKIFHLNCQLYYIIKLYFCIRNVNIWKEWKISLIHIIINRSKYVDKLKFY